MPFLFQVPLVRWRMTTFTSSKHTMSVHGNADANLYVNLYNNNMLQIHA